MRVLVVEDEPGLADTIQKALTEEDFAVDVAADGEEALLRLELVSYDAAVLDLMLPKVDGWQVLQRMRGKGVRTPVLVLTARGQVADRVRGLNLGADDYLVKPFALSELIARLHALIRRSYGGDSPRITVGSVTIDSTARRVFREGVEVLLTPREYGILELLVRSRGRLVSRASLCEHLYTEDVSISSNVVDVHVASLRRKLGVGVIQTRRGEGYMIDA